MARVIAVALPKGGVGKTTTAVNLAASLAVAEQRTLLIDMDTFGASGIALGFTEGKVRAGLFEIFTFVTNLQHAIHRTELELLDIIPSNVQSHHTEERMIRMADNRSILRNALRPVLPRYDYIILDCPPVLRGLTTNALTAADAVLVPVRSGQFSLDALEKLLKYVDWIREVANRALEIEGILLTMHEQHTRVSDMTVRELQSRYGGLLFPITIPKNNVLGEASFYGKPAILFRAGAPGPAAYLRLAREIMSRHPAAPMPGTRELAAAPLKEHTQAG
jgi:chromosome partitioning protein